MTYPTVDQVLAQYNQPTRAFRQYSTIRMALCPYAQIVDHVPAQGRLLDIGCSFGLWLNYLSLCKPNLELTGIDVDARKLDTARTSLNKDFQIFLTTTTDIFEPALFDCITIIDVLYLVSPAIKTELIQACFRLLKPGGCLILKELDTLPTWKYWLSWAEEVLAVNIVGLTYGAKLYFASSVDYSTFLQEAGFVESIIYQLEQKYWHPNVLITGKKA